MKKVVRNGMIYLMTVILFTASTGFTLFSHACFMNGKYEVSAKKISSCCENKAPAEGSGYSSKCCEYNSGFLKFTFSGIKGSTSASINWSAINVHFTTIINTGISPDLFIRPLDLPPPKSGRELLSQIQVLRV